MSSLLEEALVEAGKLKDAAKQQATMELTEKYAKELNDKMNKILEEEVNPAVFEADDDDLGGLEDLDLGGEEGGEDMDLGFDDDLEFVDDTETDYLDDQIPYGFANDENMCPCPDDEEEIEIDFNDLVGGEEDAEGMEGSMDRGEVMDDVAGDDEDYLEEFDLEEMGLDASMLEELAVDTEPAKSGWSPRPDAHFEDEIDRFLADLENTTTSTKTGKKDVTNQVGPADKIQDKEDEDESLEENKLPLGQIEKIIDSKLKGIRERNERLLEENKELKKYNDKFSRDLQKSVKILKHYQLENAKLKYQKRVVENASLNERQKSKIVEAISRANSESEAETVFKLQESVASNSAKNESRTENPLQEVLNRRPKPHLSVPRRNSSELNESNANPEKERQRTHWQKLAGIKDN